MSTAEKRSISPQEYLTIERASEIRHEYYNGEMFAMSGATRGHNVIAEVLSKSTEGYDRGTKFEMYRRLPSLQDYVLVSPD